jgi:2-octaprenylphenol hydroxylase
MCSRCVARQPVGVVVHVQSADPVFDVAVVGGGLIGAVAALAAAYPGRQVVLIEQSAPAPGAAPDSVLGLDLRTVALAPAAQALLERLGVWSRLVATPYGGMRVCDARGTAVLAFDAASADASCLGYMLENSPTLLALWSVLEAHPGITLVRGAPLDAVSVASASVQLTAGPRTVQARLVLAADGAQSRVRSALAEPAMIEETGHHALATVVRTRLPHAGIAWQVFQPEGPVALLPTRLADCVSVVWSQPPALAAHHLALSETDFCAALTRASSGRLGEVLVADRRLVFPLRQMLAANLNPHPRVALIGDAAHVLHPLAGLGANLGFEDVQAVLDLLLRLPADADPGAPGLWTDWARRRHARAASLVALMSGLKRLFANAGPLPQWLRNTGIRGIEAMPSLKQALMREAMGIGPLAAQARGGALIRN